MAKTRTPSPIPLTNDIYGTWKSLTIAAGLELNVFTLIADGKRTAAEVATAAGADSSAMRRLLDALVALKYLRRKGDQYSLEPISATFLAGGATSTSKVGHSSSRPARWPFRNSQTLSVPGGRSRRPEPRRRSSFSRCWCG